MTGFSLWSKSFPSNRKISMTLNLIEVFSENILTKE